MKTYLQKIWAMVLVVSMVHLSCARPAAASFSVGEEREVGEALLYQVRLAFSLLDDPDISQYINDLGADVLQMAGIQYFNYHFFVINDKEFNAFAAPSGLIFFHSGLIETIDNEDELVSVMAHEVGHVVSRHIASRMDKGMKVGIGALALAIAGLALGGGGVAGQALVTGSMAANEALNLHFSRQDEKEADLLSYGWMKKLGRDPEAMEKMLQVMRRITRYRMGQVPPYLLTHPDPEARLGYIQSLIAIENPPLSKQFKQTDNFAFLRTKYRILSQVEDEGQFRDFLINKISDPQATPLERIMAKYGLSQVEREASNYERSQALLREVIAALPDKPILLVDLGRGELALGHKDKALELTLKASLQNPADLWAVFQLAKIYQELGNTKEAEVNLFTVAREMPQYSEVYFEIGKLRSTQGKPGEASYFLGKYDLYEGRIKLARENFKKVVKDSSLPLQILEDAVEMLATIKRLEDKLGSATDNKKEKVQEEERGRRLAPHPLWNSR
ncbi:MAG: M48 family metalloprotease [Deltaproteobacteria bacterium]|nr:M48 family metalloprotease [Deltaproteobacteria bacterium]